MYVRKFGSRTPRIQFQDIGILYNERFEKISIFGCWRQENQIALDLIESYKVMPSLKLQ